MTLQAQPTKEFSIRFENYDFFEAQSGRWY